MVDCERGDFFLKTEFMVNKLTCVFLLLNHCLYVMNTEVTGLDLIMAFKAKEGTNVNHHCRSDRVWKSPNSKLGDLETHPEVCFQRGGKTHPSTWVFLESFDPVPTSSKHQVLHTRLFWCAARFHVS